MDRAGWKAMATRPRLAAPWTIWLEFAPNLARGELPLAADVAARFEACSDSSIGCGRAPHSVDSQGNWGPASDRQPLALKGRETSLASATDGSRTRVSRLVVGRLRLSRV